MYICIIHVQKYTTYWFSHSFIQWTLCAGSGRPCSGDRGLHAVPQHPQTPHLCWKRCWFLRTATRKECNLWGLNMSSEVWGVLSPKEAQHPGEDGAPEPTWWGESLGGPQRGGDSELSAESAGRQSGGSFPSGSDRKEYDCNAGDSGSIPGLGRSPGGGHGNPLQYSCLGNPMDREAWWLQSMGSQKLDRT